MARGRSLVGLALVIGGLTVSGAQGATARLPAPTVIATSRGEIDLVAQDATHVVWCETPQRMHVTSIARHSDRIWSIGETCPRAGTLTLAGSNAAMAGFSDAHGGVVFYTVSALSGARAKSLYPSFDYGGVGTWYRGLASDGADSYVALLGVDGDDNYSLGTCPCRFTVAGAAIYRITGARFVRLHGVPPADQIAAGDGLIALVEPQHGWTGDAPDGIRFPRAAAHAKVEIIRGRDQRVLTTFRPAGLVRGIGISRRHVVVVTTAGGVTRLESREPSNGRLERTVSLRGPIVAAGAVVPDAPMEVVSTSGDFAVAVHGEHEMWIVDLRSGNQLAVDRGAATLVGVSLVGRRLTWGENRGRVHRILGVTLPPA